MSWICNEYYRPCYLDSRWQICIRTWQLPDWFIVFLTSLHGSRFETVGYGELWCGLISYPERLRTSVAPKLGPTRNAWVVLSHHFLFVHTNETTNYCVQSHIDICLSIRTRPDQCHQLGRVIGIHMVLSRTRLSLALVRK